MNRRTLISSVGFADICIVSSLELNASELIDTALPGPEDAFRLSELRDVAVVVERAPGAKCARSWKYFDPATADPEFPDVTPRDAQALRELRAAGRA